MPRFTLILILLAALTGGGNRALAARPGDLANPVNISGVGMIERPGDLVPLNLSFTNELGRPVVLSELLIAGKPIVLNLGYFNCPSVCNLVMNGMTQAMKDTSLMPGIDYVVISLSIDPAETDKLALAKKSNYVRVLNEGGPTSTGKGWHFLTGSEANIRAVANAVGYEYKWVEEAREFAHPAGLIILTPKGHVSRYLHGQAFPGNTFRLSLVEASQGKIGSLIDQIMLICFSYDKDQHKYTLAAVGLMKLGGAATIFTLLVLAALMVRRERRMRQDLATTATQGNTGPSTGQTST